MTKSKQSGKKKQPPKKTATKSKKGGARPNAGAPIRVLDEDDFKRIGQLASISCTHDEICSVMEIDDETLKLCFLRQKGIEFSQFYKRHYQMGNQSLRRRQMQAALDGSVPMMIWLGKQRLEQTDQIHQKNTGEQKVVHELSSETIKKINEKLDEEY